MRYLDKRADVICRELKQLSVKKAVPIENWEYKKGFWLFPSKADEDEAPWEPFDSKTMHWYGPDAHCFFRAKVRVPKELAGQPLWLLIAPELGMTKDSTKNPQFLLFLNDSAVQGMDINHREAKLCEEAMEGEELQIGLQAYSGLDFTEFRLEAELFVPDLETAALYYDIWVPLQAFGRMDKENQDRIQMTAILNEAVNLIDLREPYSQAYYESVRQARGYLKEELYEKRGGYEEVIASCIGHTHIDVAWLWTVEQTREKAVRSFSTVLKLMEEYPDYKFMSSQPQLYVFVKERYPQVYQEICKRIKEGRWEPEGGMWVEADCNLTSGESLVRQFLYGKRFFKEEFGVDNKILWLPDVFGYSGALPQIMRGCGIEYFMTTKLSWNQINQIPNDTMIWRGIDGSEVLTHMITTVDIGQNIKNFFTTYNGRLHPDSIMGGWERYQNKEINNDILVAYGFGDGGGGPTREMLETSKRMEKGLKGIPKVRQVFSRTYFEELRERVEGSKRLPVWEGEFYFEYHRGTYTSMGRNKRANRKCELKLMDLELLRVLASQKGLSYPVEKLEQIWKKVLLNQFHDILPGSSIRQVYDVTRTEYEELFAAMEELTTEALETLTEASENISVLNTIGMETDAVILIKEEMLEPQLLKEASEPSKEPSGLWLSDEEGNGFPMQRTKEGFLAKVKGLPSMGSRVCHVTLGEQATNPFILTPYSVETPLYRAVWDDQGNFVSIYDKREEREVLAPGGRGNLLRMYEDKPMAHNNWDIDVYYSEKSWDITQVEEMDFVEEGPVRATLLIKRSFSRSSICQRIHFYPDTMRIDFETVLDWKDNQHLLKACFPVDVHSTQAAFEIQFGNVKRNTHANTSWEEAQFETCAHKWADLSEGNYGVSLLNDCKYGHSIKNGEMTLTLVKSGNHPNPQADREVHYFTYALYPHQGDLVKGDTVREAEQLNRAPYVVKGTLALPSFCSVDCKNIRIETIKRAEDGRGLILRLYENQNARTRAVLFLPPQITRLIPCNLLEEEKGEAIPVREGRAEILVKPFEIQTYRLQ